MAHIRWLIRRDIPEIMAIGSGITEEELLRQLRQRNCIGMVVEQGERVVGFMVYELHTTSLRLLNMAVHPSYRRQRFGSKMIAKLVSKLASHRRNKITFEVQETNLGAQLFLRANAFKAVQILRNFFDNDQDAYLMQYNVQ